MREMVIADLFCGAGGAAMGIHYACQKAGVPHRIVGFDIKKMPRYPFEFVLQDALTVNLEPFDAVWASPPCQGYSIMNNLPWLRGREYPLLILPTLEMLEATGKPFILENVMGARHGAKGLAKRGLEAHGLEAGWLCGTMFGLPFYRHRLFASNFLWLAPEHPKHLGRILQGRNLGERQHNVVFSEAEDAHGAASWPNRRSYNKGLSGVLSLTPPNADVHQSFSVRAASPTLADWQNKHPGDGVGVDHARGWRLAAEAMGIDWMKREELTQAIPPAYSCYIWQFVIAEWKERDACI